MTVCTQETGKWPVLVEALDYFDTDGLIFDFAKNLSLAETFWYNIYTSKEIINATLNKGLKLDRDLPSKLGLLPFEKDVFYLAHFASYTVGRVEPFVELLTGACKIY